MGNRFSLIKFPLSLSCFLSRLRNTAVVSKSVAILRFRKRAPSPVKSMTSIYGGTCKQPRAATSSTAWKNGSPPYSSSPSWNTTMNPSAVETANWRDTINFCPIAWHPCYMFGLFSIIESRPCLQVFRVRLNILPTNFNCHSEEATEWMPTLGAYCIVNLHGVGLRQRHPPTRHISLRRCARHELKVRKQCSFINGIKHNQWQANCV